MDDAAKVVENLKVVEKEMDRYEWYRQFGYGDFIRDAVRLIERLTPKPIKGCPEEPGTYWMESKTAIPGRFKLTTVSIAAHQLDPKDEFFNEDGRIFYGPIAKPVGRRRP